MSQDSVFCANCGKMFSGPKTKNATQEERQNENDLAANGAVEPFCSDDRCERTMRGEKHSEHSSTAMHVLQIGLVKLHGY